MVCRSVIFLPFTTWYTDAVAFAMCIMHIIEPWKQRVWAILLMISLLRDCARQGTLEDSESTGLQAAIFIHSGEPAEKLIKMNSPGHGHAGL